VVGRNLQVQLERAKLLQTKPANLKTDPSRSTPKRAEIGCGHLETRETALEGQTETSLYHETNVSLTGCQEIAGRKISMPYISKPRSDHRGNIRPFCQGHSDFSRRIKA
jgi:hypothetical protein